MLQACTLLPAQHCSAQVTRYQPSSPTVSPYLNLTRPSYGGVPNYFALVRPQIQQQNYNRQAQNLIGRQQRDILALQNEVQQELQPVSATGKGSWFMAPGTRERFLDTSRYYPQPSFNQRRR